MSLHTGLDEIRAADLPHFSVGAIIARSFWILVWNLFPFIGMSIVIAAPVVIVMWLVSYVSPMDLADFQLTSGGALAVRPGENVEFLVSIFLAVAVFLLIHVAVSYRTFHSLSGRYASFETCLIRSAALLLHVLEATIIILAVAVVLLTIGRWLLAAFGAGVLGVIAVAFALFVLAVCWVVLPAMSVERIGPVSGLVRSWRLTRGRRWRILAIIPIFAAIEYLLLYMLQIHLGFSLAFSIFGVAIDISPEAGAVIGAVLVQLPVSFFAAIVMAAGYYHLVGEKEGITRLSVVSA
jgi:hypothetical protein